MKHLQLVTSASEGVDCTGTGLQAGPVAGVIGASRPVGVMLLISSLEHGGAQRQVIELFRALDRRRFAPMICSLSSHVPLAAAFPDVQRDLVIVEKRWKFDATMVARVALLARRRRISIVHAFLFDADVAARVARRLGLVKIAISSERNSDYSFGPLKTGLMRLTRTWFDAMIANSAAGKRFNVETFGVAAQRIHVVRNGIDVERFRPADGTSLRARLGIPSDAPLVGMVASFKRQKCHGDFFRAARLVLERVPSAYFMCAGEPLRSNQQGAADYHREMRQIVDELGLGDRIIFAGAQDDMPAVYSACDVTALTSSREGTPNVLLESMACEVPVVATAIADNAVVVQDGVTGVLVRAGDVAAIADGLTALLSDTARRARLGAAARRWVMQEFSTAALARHTERVYLDALATAVPGVART